MSDPSRVPTRETVEFIQGHIVDLGPCQLLEVGCGFGQVAAALGRLGHEVVAVESDADTAPGIV